MPPVTFSHSHFIFYQKTLLYFSLSACFAGECKGPKGGEMCGNSLSVRPDPTGGRQSAAISTEVSVFYFCDATHPKNNAPHTLTARGRLNDKRFCSFGAPFSNQTLVPLYFLPVSKLCYHQCQHHSFFFFFFPQSSWLTVYRASEAAGESGVIRETMDTSLSNKQDRLCCLPVGDSGKRKGLWERERERDW